MQSRLILGSTANLIIAAAGAGILSFPFAMERAGLLFGTILCALFAVLNVLSLRVVARQSYNVSSNEPKSIIMVEESSQSLLHDAIITPTSYVQLIDMKLGANWAHVAGTSIYVGIYGALIGYLIIISDLVCPVLEQWAPESVITDRSLVIVLFVLVVIFPLSTIPHLESLTLSSVLAILSVLVVVLLVIYRSLEHVSMYTYEILPPTWWSVFEAMPIILFAFGCPLQVVPLLHEMRSRAQEHTVINMYAVINNTIVFCCAMYYSVGLFGVLHFGSQTEGVIVDNYSKADLFADVARILMAVHIALAYPVVLYPAQQGLLAVLSRSMDNKPPGLCTRGVAALVVCFVTAGVAILLPQVEIVFGLVGSLVATTQVLILPSVLSLSYEVVDRYSAIVSWLLLGTGIVVGVAGTVIYVSDLGGVL